MRLKQCLLSVLVLLGLSSNANAEFISTDWLVEGDSRSVLDTSTGFEWLKLDETKGKSINYVNALTGVGQQYEGWTVAQSNDVRDLMVNALGDSYGVQCTGLCASYENHMNVMGKWDVGSAIVSRGWSLAEDNNAEAALSGVIYNVSNGSYFSNVVSAGGYSREQTSEWLGVYFMSAGGTTFSSQNDPSINVAGYSRHASVPEPTSLVLFSLALTGLLYKRRKKV